VDAALKAKQMKTDVDEHLKQKLLLLPGEDATAGTRYNVPLKQPLDHEGGSCVSDVRLRGHDKDGYGLSWNPFKEGYLLSGSNDIITMMPHDHGSMVEDASWHLMNDSLFGSVGDDCKMMIWDLRTNKHEQAVVVHEKEVMIRCLRSSMLNCIIASDAFSVHLQASIDVNYLSFNPYNEWVLATASSDTTVGLFDMRKLTAPLHVLSNHTTLLEEVFQVEWDPNHEIVLASSADDRRLMVWDLNMYLQPTN
ncbi:WD40 repeat-containing protein MSI2-like protein, partial [Tanacetum coccineum]